MAALNIQKHFSGLRVGVDRRRGRDPFATGFEDDSDEKSRPSRPKTKAPPIKPRVPAAAAPKPDPTSAIAALDVLLDSDEDFLDVPKTDTKKATDRRPSPAPGNLALHRVTDGAGRRGSLPGVLPPTKRAAELAVGQLAYLDDSSDDERPPPSKRSGRRNSPAPRKSSDDSWDRSDTPRGDRVPAKEAPVAVPIVPAHTVASPFAGTKYLQDSETDSDEEAVSSRKGSTESTTTVSTTPPDPSTSPATKKTYEVPRVDKAKLHGGVSWRAFSAGRAEQRHAEVEALAASLQRRGRSISFCPLVTTDDGRRVPLSPSIGPLGSNGRRKSNTRGKSPPRRPEDVGPADDAGGDGRIAFTGNPFAGQRARSNSDDSANALERPTFHHSSLPDIRIDDVANL
ncbi:uncharacterized protein RCC_00740 [Ramularia collo-cygni]|uniref:Uncharacterized protein n=1 Tax=Ramularia collo-cygni TaxID=112498 RepID=A0A2D3UZX5_9PEZI|nr:uncharacterized protein RCC_00740 [Ramularia collo-cygni]CZT14789.1 uncharacterized protein RCC_00740 [Ramularia collo-cygni]